MHQSVQDYLIKKANEKAALDLEEKNKLLLELDLVEKEYSDTQVYSKDYPYFDNQVSKYFRKKPVEISDSEYEEILKYQTSNSAENQKVDAYTNDDTNKNAVANIFKVFAWIIFIGGFIAGIALGRDFWGNFSFGPAAICWAAAFVAGMLYYGVAEIIQLLADIKNK